MSWLLFMLHWFRNWMYKVLVSNKVTVITIMNWYFYFMCICQVGLRLSGLKIVKKKKKKKKRTRGTSVHKQISLPSSHSSLSKENFSNISMQQIFLLWVSDMKGYIFLTIKEMSSTLKLPWVTTTEFLLTVSIKYQPDKWWE